MEWAIGAAVLVVAAFVITLAVRSNNKSVQQAEAEESARVLTMHEKGLCDADGRPLCRAEGCKEIATRPMPVVDRTALDKMWPFRWLNQLYAMPPRYAVSAADPLVPKLCGTHGRRAVEKCEHFTAKLRAKHAEFNAEQLEQVAMMNQGGLLKLLKVTDRKIADSLGHAELQLLGAPSNGEDHTVALPAKTPEEET